MKRQPTASTVGGRARKGAPTQSEVKTGGAKAAKRLRTPFSATTSVRSASIERDVALASVGRWTHTLVLTGELTRTSAHTLEVEIERLCAEGVTGITLDLRELSYIDAIGVTVIAFRSRLCERRGYDFALIADAPLMRRAFEQAGVKRLLSSESEADEEGECEAQPAPLRALALAHGARDEQEA
jgi:anti-anti-sigma factor